MIEKKQAATFEGQPVYLFHIQNSRGSSIDVLEYGATLFSVRVPDRRGVVDEVTVGFADPAQYIGDHHSLGTALGRCSSRICAGRLTVNGTTHQLALNDGENHLHGGPEGFGQRLWRGAANPEKNAVELMYVSPDGDQGYPGELLVRIAYSLTEEDVLRIEYFARAQADTYVGLSNHAYFNLSGAGDTLDHVLTILAGNHTPLSEKLLPTGQILPVADTPLDFTSPRAIGESIFDKSFPPLVCYNGYDTNYVLDGTGFQTASVLYDPKSGRRMTTRTDLPCLQLFTAQNLSDKLVGKKGPLGPYHAVCLEAQRYPDSANRPEFPSSLLKKGEEYRYVTEYAFEVI